MNRISDESWVRTLPLTDGPVIRPEVRLLEPTAFDTQSTKAATCDHCGEPFRRMRSTKRYCTQQCQRRAWVGKE